jgi:hypothetical protein
MYFIRFYKQDISNYYNPLNKWRNIQVLPGININIVEIKPEQSLYTLNCNIR